MAARKAKAAAPGQAANPIAVEIDGPALSEEQAIANAEAQAQAQGADAERTARLRVEFLDRWRSRWSRR